jgi:plasmid maintenance system antidote protein VapI
MNRAVAIYLNDTKNSQDVIKFLQGFKKGSKQIRKIFLGNTTLTESVAISFSEVVGLPVNDYKNFGTQIKLWDMSCLTNNFREFLFKFFHNRLGLNTRVSHFTEKTRWCTFCNLV